MKEYKGKAMQCRDNSYRVDLENGEFEVYESIEELTRHYDIAGIIKPSLFITYALTLKGGVNGNTDI